MRQLITHLIFCCFCISVCISCTSCSEQPANHNPEEPLRLLWAYEYSKEVDGLSSVTLQPEIINTPTPSVIVALDRQFTRLSQEEGSIIWQQKVPDNQAYYINILNYDESYIYGKIHQSTIYFAIDLQSGSLAWEKQNSHGEFYHYPRDGNNKKHIYLSGREPEIYVFSKKGEYKQTIQLQKRARAINAANNKIFIKQAWKPDSTESAYGRIVSLDTETHQRNWQYETTRGGFYYADLVLDNGTLYTGGTSGPGIFVALDAATGQVKWEHPGLLTFRFTLADGKIFVNDGQYIVALDQQTGKELWRQDFTYATTSNVAYLDGYVYHAHNGGLYVMDAQTGEVESGPLLSPDGSGFYNLNAANGRVFVQSDFHLYCYQTYNRE